MYRLKTEIWKQTLTIKWIWYIPDLVLVMIELSRDRFTQERMADPVLSIVKKLLESNTCKRPSWSTISPEWVDVKCYWYRWENLVIQDGVRVVLQVVYWYRHLWRAFIIVPDKLRSAVLTQLHNVPTAALFGVKKTYDEVKQRLYWLRMRKYVGQWCQCCEVCASH